MHVPQYKGLTIDSILEYGRKVEKVRHYLPDDRDIVKLPRQWIVNVIYSIVGDEFRTWVFDQIKSRNDHLAEQNDLMIELDPEIAAAFGQSFNISSKFVISPSGGSHR